MVKRCNWLNGLLSGINASKELQNYLRWAEARRRKQVKEFINNRIKQNKTGFSDIIKKNKLKTFSLLKPVKKHCVKGKEVINQSDCSLFPKLLLTQEKRRIKIRELLRHSLGPFVLSLVTPKGRIYKSVKSELLNA